jgi:hypothetical protein
MMHKQYGGLGNRDIKLMNYAVMTNIDVVMDKERAMVECSNGIEVFMGFSVKSNIEILAMCTTL